MNHKTVDLGILIGEKRVFGKGYGKESWKLYVDYLSTLKNIRKITAGTATCNKPMLNLIHNSKMIPDGIRKNHEIIENKDHPWFVGVQFHPEYKSSVYNPHPIFVNFVKASLKNYLKK